MEKLPRTCPKEVTRSFFPRDLPLLTTEGVHPATFSWTVPSQQLQAKGLPILRLSEVLSGDVQPQQAAFFTPGSLTN